MNVDRFALAAWNAANARARDDYFALRALEEGLCRQCQLLPRYRLQSLCAPCLNVRRIMLRRAGS